VRKALLVSITVAPDCAAAVHNNAHFRPDEKKRCLFRGKNSRLFPALRFRGVSRKVFCRLEDVRGKKLDRVHREIMFVKNLINSCPTIPAAQRRHIVKFHAVYPSRPRIEQAVSQSMPAADSFNSYYHARHVTFAVDAVVTNGQCLPAARR